MIFIPQKTMEAKRLSNLSKVIQLVTEERGLEFRLVGATQ